MAKTAKNTTSFAPVIFIFCFTLGYIATGFIYLDEESRRVPILTGYVTIFLLALETLKWFIPSMSQEPKDTSGVDAVEVPVSREVIGLGYVVFLASMIYVFGFYVAIPIYLFVAIAFLGSQTKKTAGISAVVASIIIYVVFELILETRLYQGLLFS
jgi:putative tricarboxylic transport membrane protein